MSLKISKIETPLQDFVYGVTQSNNNTILVTIVFYHNYKDQARVYQLGVDTRFPTISLIENAVNNAFQYSKNNILVIREDEKRSYIYFDLGSTNTIQFTGNSY